MSHAPLAPATVAHVASNDPPASGVVPDPVLPAVAAGDDRAMDELWHRYADRVRALGLRLSGYDARFADDLVQETFAKLWRGAARFDPTLGTETTFVFTVARRRRGRSVAAEPPSGRRPTPRAPTGIDGRGDERTGRPGGARRVGGDGLGGHRRPRRAAAAQREVIDLAYYGQLTQREIAERLRIPLGTVKTRDLQRAQEPASRDDHERGDGMTDDLDLTEDHERVRIDLGGYVLGNLTVEEQHAVEAHLASLQRVPGRAGRDRGHPVLLDLARPTPIATPPPTMPRPASLPEQRVLSVDRTR